jgi:hypothetical protein
VPGPPSHGNWFPPPQYISGVTIATVPLGVGGEGPGGDGGEGPGGEGGEGPGGEGGEGPGEGDVPGCFFVAKMITTIIPETMRRIPVTIGIMKVFFIFS